MPLARARTLLSLIWQLNFSNSRGTKKAEWRSSNWQVFDSTICNELPKKHLRKKQAILESRYRAARHVNKEVLALYYWVGNYVSVHSRTDAWNTNAIATISKMLQQELPGLTGFSETNIKNMRIFYETWSPILNRQPLAADLDNILNLNMLLNRQLMSADLSERDFECFLSVGFTHHREIIERQKQ